jgi:uncharacterized membrane protein
MRTIWKFPLELTDGVQQVDAPGPFAIVRFAMQGQPCVWAIVESEALDTSVLRTRRIAARVKTARSSGIYSRPTVERGSVSVAMLTSHDLRRNLVQTDA